MKGQRGAEFIDGVAGVHCQEHSDTYQLSTDQQPSHASVAQVAACSASSTWRYQSACLKGEEEASQ